MNPKSVTAPFYQGVSVLLIGGEPTLFTGRLLADLGAGVTLVEPPGGDPYRRVGPHLPSGTGVDWWALTRDFRSIEADPRSLEGRTQIRELLRYTDLLVESLPPGEIDQLGLGRKPLQAENPGLIQVSISPFGQTGPYAEYLGGDLVIGALAGLLDLCGDLDRAPVRIGVSQGIRAPAAQAAAAAAIALSIRQRTGVAQTVDVSAQAAVAWNTHPTRQLWLLNEQITRRAGVHRPFGERTRRLIYPCADGYVAVQGVLGREWPALVEWLAEEGMDGPLRDPKWQGYAEIGGLVPGGIPDDVLAELDTLIIPFFQRFPKRRLFEEGQRRRIIMFPVNDAADLSHDPQLRHRQFFQPVEVEGKTLEVLGPAVRIGSLDEPVQRNLISATEPPFPTPASPSLRGLRILDFSWVGAGPLTTTLLALHGADVIRVETSLRPDVLRVTPPFVNGEPNIEASGYFYPLNPNKRDISINLATPEGLSLAKRLVAVSDAVVESFTPRVMRQLGLSYQELKPHRPDLVMMSLSMAGQSGPDRDALGFGTVLQAAVGFPAVTGWPDRAPTAPGLPFTDWLVPLVAMPALLSAIDFRDRTGAGSYLDCSQYEAALTFLGPAWNSYALTGIAPGREGNRLTADGKDLAFPHGVYQARDGWLAVACFVEDQWQRLASVIGDPPGGQKQNLMERLANRDEIDRWLESWAGQQPAAEAMELLQAAGVPAGVVHTARTVCSDPQLAHRSFGTILVHPEAGPTPYDPPAFSFSATPVDLQPAPTIGQHNAEVLGELLGLTSNEIDALADAGALL